METLQLTKNDLGKLVEILNAGGVIAFPTDTVYGVAVRYDSMSAIALMKQAKQRPETKPFPMMVSLKSQIEMVAELNARDHFLIQKWMPGAMTFIFNKKPEIDEIVTNGYPTIGIRMPDDEFVLELIQRVGVPLLVPSANISGMPSATTHEEVLKQLGGRINAVVIGESGAARASTIIDTTKEELTCIREGFIRLEDVIQSYKEETK